MKKLLLAVIVLSSFLISQSLTEGWYNKSFDVPGTLWTNELEVLGGTPGVGKVLTDDGTGLGVAIWSASAAGFTNPMTTRGDIIYRDPTNVTARLGLGANLFVLQSDGTDLEWSEFLASEMNIVDGGGIITATKVEAALQENRTASDLNTSLLNVTPGTATASKALVVDANKDITLGTGDLIATNLTGTLQTAAQPNITSLGTQSSFLATIGGFGIARTDGTAHIQTATAGLVTASTSANDLVIENNDHGGFSILVPDVKEAGFYFGSPTDAVGAFFNWTYSTGVVRFMTSKVGGTLQLGSGNQVVALTIEDDQDILFSSNVGIGVTPLSLLHINTTTEETEFVDAGSTGATEQDWIEVEIGGVQGYIRVYSTK